jgi:hypothetical protein
VSTLTQTAESTNYSAKIIEVKNLVPLTGLDNLVGLPVDGFTALVPRSTRVGDILVVFPAESQIEGWFLAIHNLYAHSGLNSDNTVKGYIGDNRRVRAIKLRGNVSSALAMSAVAVGATKADVGTLFDTVDGVLLLKKYELPTKPNSGKGNQAPKERDTSVVFPVHYDTANYWRNVENLAPDDFVTVTQKLHGTSVRFGRVPATRKLTWKERWAKRFGVQVSQHTYEFVVGSRKVTKTVGDSPNPDANHWYSSDLWTESVIHLADSIPEGVMVFGELIGWTPDGAPIQKGYTYNVPKGEVRLYIYRVATVNARGQQFDLSWEGVKAFASERGLFTVPELWSGFHRDFEVDTWIDKRFHPLHQAALPLSDRGTVDEGVVVRREGVVPYALKAKSPIFLGFETKVLDEGTEVLS